MKMIADTHVHSCACSHAYSTIVENIQAARQAGMIFMAVTEHGPNMPDAPHRWYHTNLHELPYYYNGVYLLHGVEADVMDAQGGLDLDDQLLSGLDWVIASMHPPCFAPASPEEHTTAWLHIAENPNIDVIGHCGDGRYPFDYKKGILAFKEWGKLVEINNNSAYCRPGAKENCIEIARLCKKYEVPVVVNTDAHFCSKIGHFDESLQMLEELGFPEKLVVNADAERFTELVRSKSPHPEEYRNAPNA